MTSQDTIVGRPRSFARRRVTSGKLSIAVMTILLSFWAGTLPSNAAEPATAVDEAEAIDPPRRGAKYAHLASESMRNFRFVDPPLPLADIEVPSGVERQDGVSAHPRQQTRSRSWSLAKLVNHLSASRIDDLMPWAYAKPNTDLLCQCVVGASLTHLDG
ncbi:MAG: hypothetical protein ABL897_09660 [Hyphomicrobium sp.]